LHRILFVEDAATMRSLLAFSLEELEQSTKIVEAASGFEALRFLPREDFNLVVKDINMPDINGHQGGWWPHPGGSGRERKRDWRDRSRIFERDERRTTEDQSAGIGRIRDNVLVISGAVEKIIGSLREQSEGCAEVKGFSDGVAEGSHTHEAGGRPLRESMLGLSAEVEELREGVERFCG